MNDYTPHGFCLAWEPALLTLTIAAHAMIVLSYYGIPLVLLASLYRLAPLTMPRWLIVLFALFIAGCGTGHLMDVVTLWEPWYWLQTAIHLATGVVSLATLVFLPVAIGQIRRQLRSGL